MPRCLPCFIRRAATTRRYNTQAPHANNNTAAPAPTPIPAAAPAESPVDEDAGDVAPDTALVVWPVAVACWLLGLYKTILK